jgi:hypothetical protein
VALARGRGAFIWVHPGDAFCGVITSCRTAVFFDTLQELEAYLLLLVAV